MKNRLDSCYAFISTKKTTNQPSDSLKQNARGKAGEIVKNSPSSSFWFSNMPNCQTLQNPLKVSSLIKLLLNCSKPRYPPLQSTLSNANNTSLTTPSREQLLEINTRTEAVVKELAFLDTMEKGGVKVKDMLANGMNPCMALNELNNYLGDLKNKAIKVPEEVKKCLTQAKGKISELTKKS